MSVMDDMLAWLTATLDELQQIAEDSVEAWDNAIGWDEPAAHIMRHSPRAVLARVAAERAILADIAASTAQYPDFDGGTVNGLENAAMLIAWGHRYDAPGFQPSWAPSNVEVTT